MLKALKPDVLCLQETELNFVNFLDELFRNPDLNTWKIYYAHTGYGGNLAIAWDTYRLDLNNFESILLPQLPRSVIFQRLKGHTKPLQRSVLVGTFLTAGKVLRISNLQLSWEGGSRFRLGQLAYFLKKLHQSFAHADIIAGDFNTWVPSAFRRGQEKKVERLLGKEYINVLPNLRFTCDTSYVDPQDWWFSLSKILAPIGIKMRTRLDYIFARNLNVISSKMLDWPGSDHRPLIGIFDFIF